MEIKNIKVRLVHSKCQTWNSLTTICIAFLRDKNIDFKVVLGCDADDSMLKQVEKIDCKYVCCEDYDAKIDAPDIVILTHPYDKSTYLRNVNNYAKLVVIASVLLIQNTDNLNTFWKVQKQGFERFSPQYYLCDSLLYNEIKDDVQMEVELINMGNAKYDGIFQSLKEKTLPLKWTKLRGKRVVLWTTDHGIFDDRIEGETFDLYARDFFYYIKDTPELGFIFRPHPVLLKEMIKQDYWTEDDIDKFRDYCDKKENLVFDESEDYDAAFSIADAIIADASCGITVSALPTRKPICALYREPEDFFYDEEYAKCLYNTHSFEEINAFLELVKNNEDPLAEYRVSMIDKYVKHFDGKNGERIKEFVLDKYYETIMPETNAVSAVG